MIFFLKKNPVLRGRVVCVSLVYSSGEYAAAQVEETQCLVKKLWLQTVFFNHVDEVPVVIKDFFCFPSGMLII